MSTSIPYRLANGVGNPPDADRCMADYDWLTALIIGNLTQNGGFESWDLGTSFTNPANGTSILTPWSLRKTGTSAPTADVSREATIIDTDTYAIKFNITVAGSANSILAIDESYINSAFVPGQTFATVWRVRASTGSKVRLKIYDGTTTAYSSYHTGGGTYETLYASLTASTSATTLTISLEITSDFTGAVYADGATLWVVPANIGTAAKAALTYSRLFSFDIPYGAGLVPIVTSPDGLHTYRIFVDNDGSL